MDNFETVWEIGDGGTPSIGPFTTEQLTQMLRTGRIRGTMHCRQVGTSIWRRVDEVEPLSSRIHSGSADNNLIRFNCTCGKRIVMSRKFAGRRAKCNNCGKVVTVPAAPPEEETDWVSRDGAAAIHEPASERSPTRSGEPTRSKDWPTAETRTETNRTGVSTSLYVLRATCLCLPCILGLTALAQWLMEKKIDESTLMVTAIALANLSWVFAWVHRRRVRELRESNFCCACGGSGHVWRDPFNEEICPMCSGHGVTIPENETALVMNARRNIGTFLSTVLKVAIISSLVLAAAACVSGVLLGVQSYGNVFGGILLGLFFGGVAGVCWGPCLALAFWGFMLWGIDDEGRTALSVRVQRNGALKLKLPSYVPAWDSPSLLLLGIHVLLGPVTFLASLWNWWRMTRWIRNIRQSPDLRTRMMEDDWLIRKRLRTAVILYSVGVVIVLLSVALSYILRVQFGA